MSRAFLQIVLPLVLPTVLYLIWVIFIRKPGPDGDGDVPHWLRHGPWLWLIAAGIALMAIVLAVAAWLTGGDPGGTYVPPRLENGRVVPGRIE